MGENMYIKFLKQKYKDRVKSLRDCGGRVSLLRCNDSRGGSFVNIPPELAPKWRHEISFLDAMRVYGLQEMLDNGVKVVQFGQDYADAFMMTDPNICSLDYSQPYGVMMVDFPDNFIQEHFRKFGQADQLVGYPSPKTAMVAFEPKEKVLFMEVAFSNGSSLFKNFKKPDGELSELIANNEGSIDGLEKEMTADDQIAMTICARVAINALLTADGRMDEKGYENPGYAAKLDRYIRKADTDKKLFQATLDKQTLPFILNYSRSTVTYRRSSDPSDGDPTGKTVGPHWRRGHYRIQRFGAGLKESKRVRIAPVFVNLHLVPADFNLGETVTGYRINNPLPTDKTDKRRPAS